nr:uncharacterized mitochondrial protein AtMg00810-like [Tanacetum cinerariifolium]
MAVITKRINDLTKKKSEKGNNEKVKSEKGLIAEPLNGMKNLSNQRMKGPPKSRHSWQLLRMSHRDHLGKFNEKADDGFFLGYSLVAKSFRVFNIKRQEMEETVHVTFNEDDEAISQSSTKGDEINFNENRSFPNDEFLEPRTYMGFMVYQMDVKGAFLNGKIPEEVYQANPKESHLVAVNRCLKGTPNVGLWYPKGSGFDLKAYFDLDYAGYIGAIIFSDLVNKLQNGKKIREANIYYTRFLSLMFEKLLGENYINGSLTFVNTILAASFQKPLASEVRLTPHMLKVAKLSKKPEPSLILSFEKVNADDIADKSSSMNFVQPVTQPNAPTDLKSKKKKIPLSSQPKSSYKIIYEIDHKNKDAKKAESPYDTVSEIKIIKSFQAAVVSGSLLIHQGSQRGFKTPDSANNDSQEGTAKIFYAFADKPGQSEPLGYLHEELCTLNTKINQLESSITKQVTAAIQSSMPLIVIDTLKAKLPGLLSEALKELSSSDGIPPPPELSTFGVSINDKKRKRSSEILKEVHMNKDILVDRKHRKLVPPPRVEGRKWLVIREPKSGIFFYNGNFDLVFQREEEFHLATTAQLIRLYNFIQRGSPKIKEMFSKLELTIEAREDVAKAIVIIKDNLDGLGQHIHQRVLKDLLSAKPQRSTSDVLKSKTSSRKSMITRRHTHQMGWILVDLKLKTTEDNISIGSFMKALVLILYVLVKKIFHCAVFGHNDNHCMRKERKVQNKTQENNNDNVFNAGNNMGNKGGGIRTWKKNFVFRRKENGSDMNKDKVQIKEGNQMGKNRFPMLNAKHMNDDMNEDAILDNGKKEIVNKYEANQNIAEEEGEDVLENLSTASIEMVQNVSLMKKDPHNVKFKEDVVNMLHDYNEVVKDEESFLFQMSKIKWMKEGDKSTVFLQGD